MTGGPAVVACEARLAGRNCSRRRADRQRDAYVTSRSGVEKGLPNVPRRVISWALYGIPRHLELHFVSFSKHKILAVAVVFTATAVLAPAAPTLRVQREPPRTGLLLRLVGRLELRPDPVSAWRRVQLGRRQRHAAARSASPVGGHRRLRHVLVRRRRPDRHQPGPPARHGPEEWLPGHDPLRDAEVLGRRRRRCATEGLLRHAHQPPGHRALPGPASDFLLAVGHVRQQHLELHSQPGRSRAQRGVDRRRRQLQHPQRRCLGRHQPVLDRLVG